MQRWQNLRVSFSNGRVSRLHGRYANDIHPENQVIGKKIDDALETLGEMGWELVAIVRNTFYFKRPKS